MAELQGPPWGVHSNPHPMDAYASVNTSTATWQNSWGPPRRGQTPKCCKHKHPLHGRSCKYQGRHMAELQGPPHRRCQTPKCCTYQPSPHGRIRKCCKYQHRHMPEFLGSPPKAGTPGAPPRLGQTPKCCTHHHAPHWRRGKCCNYKHRHMTELLGLPLGGSRRSSAVNTSTSVGADASVINTITPHG